MDTKALRILPTLVAVALSAIGPNDGIFHDISKYALSIIIV